MIFPLIHWFKSRLEENTSLKQTFIKEPKRPLFLLVSYLFTFTYTRNCFTDESQQISARGLLNLISILGSIGDPAESNKHTASSSSADDVHVFPGVWQTILCFFSCYSSKNAIKQRLLFKQCSSNGFYAKFYTKYWTC